MAAPTVRQSFDDPTEPFAAWVRQHARSVGIAALAIVVLGGGLWLYQYATVQQALHADQQLMQPERSLGAGNIPLAQNDLKQLIQRYKGTAAATQASMLLAQTYFDQKKQGDGIAVLEKVPRGGASAPFAPAVEALIGVGYSDQGKYREAAAHYLTASTLTPYAGTRGQYKVNAARALTYAGDTAQAVAVWTELAKDESSPLSAEAHLRLGELTVKAAAGAGAAAPAKK
jgi:predicted negative regulator of RcsB-dependent stress response